MGSIFFHDGRSAAKGSKVNPLVRLKDRLNARMVSSAVLIRDVWKSRWVHDGIPKSGLTSQIQRSRNPLRSGLMSRSRTSDTF